MNRLAEQVQDFYSEIKFPGLYSDDDLNFYKGDIYNSFLAMYDYGVAGSKKVLDIGCGTGFITNLLAKRHSNIQFDAIDFSDSIDYAREFSQQHKLKNVQYRKQDLFKFKAKEKYDCIISNGVLHHMPDYTLAFQKIKTMLSDNGTLVLGIYNTYGKFVKSFVPINYRSELLRADQEDVPYEISFTNKEFLNYFPEFKVDKIYPSINNKLVDVCNLTNYNNGGLTVYILKK